MEELICITTELAVQSGHLRDLKETVDRLIAEHGEWVQYNICCDAYGYLPNIDIEIYKKDNINDQPKS